jgi:hypothetical protein
MCFSPGKWLGGCLFGATAFLRMGPLFWPKFLLSMCVAGGMQRSGLLDSCAANATLLLLMLMSRLHALLYAFWALCRGVSGVVACVQ